MSCMCLAKLTEFLASLKNLPLNMLAEMIPKMPQLSMIAGAASGVGTLSAMATASARAQLTAAMNLGLGPFPIPLPELAKLESLALVAGATGVNAFGANASVALQRLATTVNLHLPSIMSLLAPLLEPLLEPLMDLLEALSAHTAVSNMLGINLAAPGAMGLLSAKFAASASLSAAASANLSAIANLGSYGRLFNAMAALGINLSSPGVMAKLNAALKLAAGLPIPPLTINLPQANSLASMLSALVPLQSSALGINMRLPNAWSLLKAALQQMLANLMEPLALSAKVSETLQATAAAGNRLSAVSPALQVNLAAVAKLNLKGLPLQLPDLSGLAVAARFGQATGLSVFASSSCSSSCPVGKTF